MKKLLALTLLTTASLTFAGTNLSDSIDANEVPAEIEEREEETINRPDALDQNTTPSVIEEREREEEWRESYGEPQYDTKTRQNKKRQ